MEEEIVWKDLWKDFTGKDFKSFKDVNITVEEGIVKYAEVVAFWNSEYVNERLPKEYVKKRLHAAIVRSGNLNSEVDKKLGFSSGILLRILSLSKDYKNHQ